jgi:hypothetical protein
MFLCAIPLRYERSAVSSGHVRCQALDMAELVGWAGLRGPVAARFDRVAAELLAQRGRHLRGEALVLP